MYKNPQPMHVEDDILATIALTLMPGIGSITARKIINQLGSASSFFETCENLRFPGMRKLDLSRTAIGACFLRAEEELRFIERQDIQAVIVSHNNYPQRLKNCEDAPAILYSRGNINLNASRMIAVVGTRKSTPYGERCCEEVLTELHKHDCSLISGLAYGIDSIAHRAAQNLGMQNIGVVAHGLDRLYPSANKSLAKKMEERGGIVTDFPSQTRPDRENFPKRNRIVAGLADAVIVIEASESGGALITADIANSYNRDVFVVPGSWGQPFSVGCNNLVKRNKAAVLAHPADLSWYLNWNENLPQPTVVQTQLFPELSPDEDSLIQLLRTRKNDLDSLMFLSGFTVSKTSALLLGLEFKGLVKSLPGKRYQLLI